MVTKTTAIKNFLEAKSPPDLAALYHIGMECQVNVAQDGGERIDGDFKGRKWHGWSDGLTTWKSFRIPYKANTVPEYTDRELKFDLAEHAEGIGMTGWDWQNRVSKWVAYDFDAILGHSEKHVAKLTSEQLAAVQKAAHDLEWVTIRKSSSGKGLHLYVFVPDVPTANHHEHAALARAILGIMSGLAGFDFQSKVDICGGNMWVWHRKCEGNDGFELIKPGRPMLDNEIPPNWRDHVKVVTRKRRKNLPQDLDSNFEGLAGQRPHTPLDEDHKKLLAYLKSIDALWWWDQDHHMLVTHTYHLKQCYEELGLKGYFNTMSEGREKGTDHNCFSGDTEIITRQGVSTLAELQGSSPELLSWTPYGLEWIRSPIQSYGIQETVALVFGDKSVIRATDGHNWLYRNNGKVDPYLRKTTCELKVGKTQLPLAKQKLPDIDWEGYAHGFVYGDGWVTARGKCDVALFKNDNDLMSILLQYGNQGAQQYPGHGYVNMIRSLPGTWKQLPDDPSREYSLGFVLGLVAADGFVDNRVQIFQSNPGALDEVRKLAIYAGLRAYPVREYGRCGGYKNAKQGYAFSISTANLTHEHFVRADQRAKFKPRRKHLSMTLSYFGERREEEVFCAKVPDTHNFVLANHIITGNCFAFPLRQGGWAIRRYSRGVQEHPSWEQDGAGWTRAYLNREASLGTASRAFGGIEDPDGSFVFREAELAISAAQVLGVYVTVGGAQLKREARLKEHKDGRLIVTVMHDPHDRADEMELWQAKAKKWVRIYGARISQTEEPDVGNYDDTVRHIVTTSDEDYGWVIRSDQRWRSEPLAHVRAALGSLGMSGKEITGVLGSSIFKAWLLVNKPFQPEYPGGREWNRNAAQFRYPVTRDRDDLKYPTWSKILDHCGIGLNDGIRINPWAKANGILTGGDYLKCWVASLFQEPMEPLPYLFFYGPQNSGKSIFHEALSLLLTKGYQRADAALISQAGFNGELEGAVICVVEETDLHKNKISYNRIKDWVTSRELPMHVKGKTPYHTQNSSHWVQCLPKSMWVQTSKGPRQVKDLINIPAIVVVDGRGYPSTGFFETGFKTVYRVTTTQGYSFEATAEHPALKVCFDLPFWTEVKDLKPGDELQLNNHKGLTWDGEGNFEEGYVLGWLVGDGSFRQRGSDPVIYFYGDKDKGPLSRCSEYLDECNILLRDDHSYTIAGKQLQTLAKRFGLESKDVNYFIESTSSDFYEGFLSGLFDADGSSIESVRRVTLYQSNKPLLEAVQRMLLRLGVTSNLNLAKEAGYTRYPQGDVKSKTSYQLAITKKENLKRLAARTDMAVHASKIKRILGSWKRVGYLTTYLAEIQSIERVREETVYDITVEGVHAFDGDGFMLHNCANDHRSCPVFAGDTRITMCFVDELDPLELIPKKQLIPLLQKEASDFLGEIMRLELPPSPDRLNIPIIVTQDKELAQVQNLTTLQQFLREACQACSGQMIKFSDFYVKYAMWAEANGESTWSKIKVGKELPPQYPKGRLHGTGQFHIGNICFRGDKVEKKPRLVFKDDYLEALPSA